MKFFSFILSATILFAACNSNKSSSIPTTQTSQSPDSLVIVNELDSADTKQQATQTAKEADKETTSKSTGKSSKNAGSGTSSASSDNASGSGNGETASAGSGTETKKKGWSKTAKGAVIGGVTGAAAGAVINKKNRGVGAVVGGVTGAAAGAIIGNEMDKKDGRH